MRGKTYIYDYKAKKENPVDTLRWLRRNMGHRGVGWDFTTTSSIIAVNIWDERLEVMWLTFKA